MITEAELLALLESHDADRVELMTSRGNTQKWSEAVYAFANDLPDHRLPGYLIVGVDDRGEFDGEPITEELLRNLGALRTEGNILPAPDLVVEKVVTANGEAAVVTVQPAELPPVRYRGRICVRIGPRRDYATEQEERRLTEKRISQARTFDAEPCLGAALSDLWKGAFLNEYLGRAVATDVIEENHRPLEQQLASLRFFDLAVNVPTQAGVLLFGMDVRRFLPGAYVQFLRVGGTSLADDILADRELDGDLLSVLRELDALVDAQLVASPVPESLLRERTVEAWPRVAVRELLLNAVLHRDYRSTAPLRISWFDDRIEIQSPGGLYGEATPQNFPQQTSYRNPVVAEALKTLGYVNRFGRGVLRAQDSLARNGSPPAEFSFDAGFVLATIRRFA